MSGAYASATRAQWAGYEAPDEKADEWPLVDLPSEMCEAYGSRRIFEFSADEDRAVLGFRPLPGEEYNSLTEELEGVIGRLADPERFSQESISFSSSTNELLLFHSTDSTSLPVDLPSPPDAPLPRTPSPSRSITPVPSSDLFATFLHDSPIADKVAKSPGVAHRTPPPTPLRLTAPLPVNEPASEWSNDLPLTPSSPLLPPPCEPAQPTSSAEKVSRPSLEVETPSQADGGQTKDEPAVEALPLSSDPSRPSASNGNSQSSARSPTPPSPTAHSDASSPALLERVFQSATVLDSLNTAEDDITPTLLHAPLDPIVSAESPPWSKNAPLLEVSFGNVDSAAADNVIAGFPNHSMEDVAIAIAAVSSPASTAVATPLPSNGSDSEWPDVGSVTESDPEEDQDFIEVGAVDDEVQSDTPPTPSHHGVTEPPTAVPEADGIVDEPASAAADPKDAPDACNVHTIALTALPGDDAAPTEPPPDDDHVQAGSVTVPPLAASIPPVAEVSADTAADEEAIVSSHTPHPLDIPDPSSAQPPSLPDHPTDPVPSHEPASKGVSKNSLLGSSEASAGMFQIDQTAPSLPAVDEGSSPLVQVLGVDVVDSPSRSPPSSNPVLPCATGVDAVQPRFASEEASPQAVLVHVSDDSLDPSNDGAAAEQVDQVQHAQQSNCDSSSEPCAQPVPSTDTDAGCSSPQPSVGSTWDKSHPSTSARYEASWVSPGDASPFVDDSNAAAISVPLAREGVASAASEMYDSSQEPPPDSRIGVPLPSTSQQPPSSPPNPEIAPLAASPEVSSASSSFTSSHAPPSLEREETTSEPSPQSPVTPLSTVLPPAAQTLCPPDTPERQAWAPSVPMASLLNYDNSNIRHSLSDIPSSPGPAETPAELTSLNDRGTHVHPEAHPSLSESRFTVDLQRKHHHHPSDPVALFSRRGSEPPPIGAFQQRAYAMPGRSRFVPSTSAIRHTVDTLVDPDSPLSAHHTAPSKGWYSLTPPPQPQWHTGGAESQHLPALEQVGHSTKAGQTIGGYVDALEEDEVDDLVQTPDGVAGPTGYPVYSKVLLVDQEDDQSEVSLQMARSVGLQPIHRLTKQPSITAITGNDNDKGSSRSARKRKAPSSTGPMDTATPLSRSKRRIISTAAIGATPLARAEAQKEPEELENVKGVVASPQSKRARGGRTTRARAPGKQRSLSLASLPAAADPEPEPATSRAPSKRKRGGPQTHINARSVESSMSGPSPTPAPVEGEEDDPQFDLRSPPSSRSTRSFPTKRKLWSQKLEGLPPSGRAKTVHDVAAVLNSPHGHTPSSSPASNINQSTNRYWTSSSASLSQAGTQRPTQRASLELQVAASPLPEGTVDIGSQVADEAPGVAVTTTTKKRSKGKKKAPNLWTEEEIQLFNNFMAAFEENNPGKNPGVEAGTLCAKELKGAGYKRSADSVLARYKRLKQQS